MLISRLCCSYKKLVILGGSCAGVYVGTLMLQRIAGGKAHCSSSCVTQDSPALAYLRRNEATVQFQHPLIKSVDVNFLPSNNPNEDRFVMGGVKKLGAGLISVIDGHKGNYCSEYLKNNLLQYVAGAVSQDHPLKDSTTNIFHTNSASAGIVARLPIADLVSYHEGDLDWSKTESRLKEAFQLLDRDISNEGLKAARKVKQGKSIHEGNHKQAILTALAGACALLSVITDTAVYVASTGDCRAVLGVREGKNRWRAEALSFDQTANNPMEVERLYAAHPGERDTVISMDRLLGNLMPLRSFGDMDLKWEKSDLDFLVPLPEFYHTPPYLTAEPVVTSRTLHEQDRFIVIATDGLWERLSNEQVVRTVVESRPLGDHQQFGGFFSFFSGSFDEQCCEINSATRVLWHALGGEENVVNELLHVPAQHSRMYRDDITILVVHLHHES